MAWHAPHGPLSFPSKSSILRAIFVALFARFLILLPPGLGFQIIFILPFRLLWNDFVIDSSSVTYETGVMQA